MLQIFFPRELFAKEKQHGRRRRRREKLFSSHLGEEEEEEEEEEKEDEEEKEKEEEKEEEEEEEAMERATRERERSNTFLHMMWARRGRSPARQGRRRRGKNASFSPAFFPPPPHFLKTPILASCVSETLSAFPSPDAAGTTDCVTV